MGLLLAGLIEYLSSPAFQEVLGLVNAVLSSGIAIFSSALLTFLLIRSPKSSVVRSFASLLACVLVTYSVDLALSGVEDLSAAVPWLRLQWLGIAFTPACYLGFSDALLVMTGARSSSRKFAVRISYVVSALFLVGATFSQLFVRDASLVLRAPHLVPGPLFPLFALYFFAAIGWGGVNVLWARRRCLTSTSRRRMSYLAATFAAPAAGVFPYLLLTGWPTFVPVTVFWVLLVLGNIGVGLMLVLLAYSVAFFGALTPDRVVKHRLVRFLLRGPLVATLVVVVIVVASQVEGWLGLPGRRLMIFGVVAVILLVQLGVEMAKPLLDRALYRRDRLEIEWIQQLGDHLLTTTDLRQFLENVLTALCDLLRVETAFATVINNGVPHLEAVCGPLELDSVDTLPPAAWRQATAESVVQRKRSIERHGDLFVWDGYWLAPLRASGQNAVIGVVGMEARAPEPNMSPEEQVGVNALLGQATAALEDRQLQQSIFRVLEEMIPEIDVIQQRRGVVHYVGQEALAEFGLVETGEFRRWVRGALTHYWGGPKLTESPLLSLSIVEKVARDFDGSVMKGLREVLKQAIEYLRPDGQRRMTAPDWILYNILELKFLQGRRVREIAMRLAMSESDLYRKQRIAIEEVARILADREREELSSKEQPTELV